MAAGAFTNLTASKFDNSSNWLTGMRAWGTYKSKLVRRPVLRRLARDHVPDRPVQEGGLQKAADEPLAVPEAARQGREDDKNVKGFSPLYIGGEDWYRRSASSSTTAGSIASSRTGSGTGTLDSKTSHRRPDRLKQFFKATQSRSTATLDGSNPFPYTVFSQGRTAANYGPAWYTCCTGKKYAKAPSSSSCRATSRASRSRDSSVARPSRFLRNRLEGAGTDWLADFTSNASEQALEKKGNIPNATNLLAKTSTSGLPQAAGSCRRRRTGWTSRTATS